jgi:hypothetical protein
MNHSNKTTPAEASMFWIEITTDGNNNFPAKEDATSSPRDTLSE